MGLHQCVPSFWIHNFLMVHPDRIQSSYHLSEIAGRYDIVISALPKICRRVLLPHMLINTEIINRIAFGLTAYRIKEPMV